MPYVLALAAMTFSLNKNDLLIRPPSLKSDGIMVEEQNFCNSVLPLHAKGMEYPHRISNETIVPEINKAQIFRIYNALNIILTTELEKEPSRLLSMDELDFLYWGSDGINWPYLHSISNSHESGYKIKSVLYALCFCGEQGISIVDLMLNDERPHVRRITIAALCDAYPDLSEVAQTKIENLLESKLNDHNPWVVVDAVTGLESSLRLRYTNPIATENARRKEAHREKISARDHTLHILGQIHSLDSNEAAKLFGLDLSELILLVEKLQTELRAKEIIVPQKLEEPEWLTEKFEKLNRFGARAHEERSSEIRTFMSTAIPIYDAILSENSIPEGSLKVLKIIMALFSDDLVDMLHQNNQTESNKLVGAIKLVSDHCEMVGHSDLFNEIVRFEINKLEMASSGTNDGCGEDSYDEKAPAMQQAIKILNGMKIKTKDVIKPPAKLPLPDTTEKRPNPKTIRNI